MWFKNVIFYRLQDGFELPLASLQNTLAEHAFTPCRPGELARYGWAAPCPDLDDELVHTVQGFVLICARKEEKILPSSVIKAALQEKVAQIELERKVFKKEKDQLKDEIILDLLPRAFSRHQQTYALISPQQGWIAVDSSSAAKAEALLSHLRGSLGSLPVTRIDVNNAPAAILSGWLSEPASRPAEFTTLDEAELRDSVTEGGVIRIKSQALEDDEFIAHLETGKRVVKLAVEWEQQLRFMLQEDLSLKRLKLSDQLQEQLKTEADEDPIAQFDADMVQMGLEFNRLLPALLQAFGGELQRQ